MNNNTQNIGRLGVLESGSILTKMNFIFRDQPISDYGIDAIIETMNQDYASGKMIAAQIKTGDSYFKEENDDSVVFRGDIKHYNYWINHSLPVIIILYSPSTGECIWESVNKQAAELTQNGWKIKIPRKKTLKSSTEELLDLANKQSDFESRWTALVVAKKWMLETEQRGKLILEVQEWINKSSGRGTFILKAIESDGSETILSKQEMLGFGIKKYEAVIQDLFPWANVEIDEEFYDENLDEDYYHTWEHCNRDLVDLINSERAEALAYTSEPSKLYPYRNGAGEVDFYRVTLTLNQIGTSFISIEHFLETGKYYLLKG